ncbi:HAMP domain-containing histidine kinase [Nakamurella flava]|uniref:histidine kinase n=1 Tax=Nakamurella flava TaxID=2576308 RepID=A0A4U6QBD5_9ACTN|nr:HAMP domain-containing sensor histidine kinase [Nakamurella flava]TKV57367.1 HAMP domain-containing histidine kinase [Nakamurella flava]
MRARIVLVLTILGALTVIAFAVPLMLTQAESRTRQLVLTRESDLQRFAALAGSWATGGPSGSLFDELRAYEQLYGEPIAVVSTRGVAPFSVGLDLNDPDVAGAIAGAVRNQPQTPDDRITPTGPDRRVFARTIGADTDISGAVVVAASTAAARADITRVWAIVAAGGVVALLALVAFAVAVSAWVLRPLRRLTVELTELAAGLPFRAGPGQAPVEPLGGGPPELRALSGTFERMARTVRGSVTSQRQLVADAAHQLRNPLAALQLRLDALDGLLAPGAQPGYAKAVAESERLAEVLDDLLALSSAEAARSTVRTCLPRMVVVDRVEFWSSTADAAGVRLDVVPPAAAGEPDVSMGQVELGQILDVLLDNACRYAGAGASVQVSVETDAPDGRFVTVSVADTGRGVPPTELDRLTTRFYRGSTSAQSDGTRSRGTGLGLAIVEALVTSAGARMSIGPTPGGGLTIGVRIPAAVDPAGDRSAEVEVDSPATVAGAP